MVTGGMLHPVTPPAETPVSLVEARAHLRLDATGGPPPTHPDDAIVTALIAAATGHLDGRDGILGRALVTQQWRLALPAFPERDGPVMLPLPPLQTVQGIEYDTPAGVTETLDPLGYETVTGDWGAGLVRLVDGRRWPITRRITDAVRVTFTAGYGAASAVPAALKAAILLHVGVLYENREATSAASTTQVAVPFGHQALVSPYRVRIV